MFAKIKQYASCGLICMFCFLGERKTNTWHNEDEDIANKVTLNVGNNCSLTRIFAQQFAFCWEISLFYSAILNFNREFDHEKD